MRVGITAIVMAACAHPAPRPATKLSPDEALVTSIRRAVVAHTPTNTIASRIGKAPLVDTTVPGGLSLAALARANIQPDPAHPAEALDLAHASAIVYWERPIPCHDAPIVGVQAGEDGSSSVFFGIVLPP